LSLMYPAPPPDELAWARDRFQALEPRDLFYRVASSLVTRAIGGTESQFTLGEAVAVLLMSWNSNYYRFRKPDPSHVGQIETVVEVNLAFLMSMRARRIDELSDVDFADMRLVFEQFDQLLGPVGAAKALHLLAPAVFPIWDGAIAIAYRRRLGPRGTNGERYAVFAAVTASQCRELAGHDDAPVDILKALDEWNYVRYTRGETFEEAERPSDRCRPVKVWTGDT
jgi:hypothetical protein